MSSNHNIAKINRGPRFLEVEGQEGSSVSASAAVAPTTERSKEAVFFRIGSHSKKNRNDNDVENKEIAAVDGPAVAATYTPISAHRSSAVAGPSAIMAAHIKPYGPTVAAARQSVIVAERELSWKSKALSIIVPKRLSLADIATQADCAVAEAKFNRATAELKRAKTEAKLRMAHESVTTAHTAVANGVSGAYTDLAATEANLKKVQVALETATTKLEVADGKLRTANFKLDIACAKRDSDDARSTASDASCDVTNYTKLFDLIYNDVMKIFNQKRRREVSERDYRRDGLAMILRGPAGTFCNTRQEFPAAEYFDYHLKATTIITRYLSSYTYTYEYLLICIYQH